MTVRGGFAVLGEPSGTSSAIVVVAKLRGNDDETYDPEKTLSVERRDVSSLRERRHPLVARREPDRVSLSRMRMDLVADWRVKREVASWQ